MHRPPSPLLRHGREGAVEHRPENQTVVQGREGETLFECLACFRNVGNKKRIQTCEIFSLHHYDTDEAVLSLCLYFYIVIGEDLYGRVSICPSCLCNYSPKLRPPSHGFCAPASGKESVLITK